MNSPDDHDAERPSEVELPSEAEHPLVRQYPVTDLLRTYLRQSRSINLFGLGPRREATTRTRAEDLWDYLGDFA